MFGNMDDYRRVLESARARMGKECHACPVCDGRACLNHIPGPGSKGSGDTAVRNYDKWREIRLIMDTIDSCEEPDTGFSAFGRRFSMPLFAGPVGAVQLHYSALYNDVSYNRVLVKACADAGIAAFTGDGTDLEVMKAAADALRSCGGIGIPTIKPWDRDTIREKISMTEAAGCIAVAMDVDAAGLPFLQGLNPPAGFKSVDELKEIIAMSSRPFIIKGIMSPMGAEKAYRAGASAIVVSNHGGRVLDQCASTAEVLPGIVDAMKGSGMMILVDGGIRTGADIFKALAIGADAVLIARPYVIGVYGGAEEGVSVLTKKLMSELLETMRMCGASGLDRIDRGMIRMRG